MGACVGIRGSRVQAVSNELNGEKIDVNEKTIYIYNKNIYLYT